MIWRARLQTRPNWTANLAGRRASGPGRIGKSRQKVQTSLSILGWAGGKGSLVDAGAEGVGLAAGASGRGGFGDRG